MSDCGFCFTTRIIYLSDADYEQIFRLLASISSVRAPVRLMRSDVNARRRDFDTAKVVAVFSFAHNRDLSLAPSTPQ
jgi:hypothetical protein